MTAVAPRIALAAALACGCARTPPILTFHSVAGGGDDAFTISRAELGADLDWLAAHGFHAVTLCDALDAADGGRALPDQPIVLTFDDGYADAFSVALPELRARGMVATFFLVADWVAPDEAHRRRVVEGGVARDYLTVHEARALAEAGNELGAHALTHRELRGATPDALRDETAGARAKLAALFGRTPATFAYPGNSVDGPARDAVRAAGYRGAVAGRHGYGLRWDLFRAGMYRGDGPSRLAALLGELDP